MEINVSVYFILFIIYAMIGWCIEIINGLIQTKKFVNRGFLIGPYCPIYGVGGILITLLLSKYYDDPIVLFFMGIAVCGILEYLTSYIMEKFFKARWWDYSKRKFNINGRICLETIIPFGLLGCFIIYISNPFFINLINKMNKNTINIIAIVLLVIFITDFIISFFIISRLRKTAKEVNEKNSGDNTEEITKKVKEILTNKSILDRRLINAFPKINIDKIKARIKENTDKVKETASKVKEEAAEKIKESAEKMKETTIKVKEDATEKIKDRATKVRETTAKVKDETVQKFKRRNNEK